MLLVWDNGNPFNGLREGPWCSGRALDVQTALGSITRTASYTFPRVGEVKDIYQEL